MVAGATECCRGIKVFWTQACWLYEEGVGATTALVIDVIPVGVKSRLFGQ